MAVKKTKTGWTYSGDLATNIEQQKRRAKMLQEDTAYILRQYQEAKARWERYNRAIENALRFVEVATAKLAEQKDEGAEQ